MNIYSRQQNGTSYFGKNKKKEKKLKYNQGIDVV